MFLISYFCLIGDRFKGLKCFLIFHGVNCFVLLVSLILAFVSINFLKDIKFSSTCFDEIMNTFIEKAKNEIHNEKVYCIIFTIFCFLCLLINILLVFFQMNICENCFKDNYGNYHDNSSNKAQLDEDASPLKGKFD